MRALRKLCVELLRRSGGCVYAGPFAGMRLFEASHLATRPMWIVGSYEAELHDVINEMIVKAPQKVIDIGSAHGYYMIGLAIQLPSATVVGFEVQEVPHWQEASQLALVNGVAERVRQEGLCTQDTLARECEPGAFVLCDCEGGEVDLLDAEKIPCLKACYILCEVHDFYRPGATPLLIDRFSATHKIKIIQEQGRNAGDYRILKDLSEIERRVAVMETRHLPGRLIAGKFLWMAPKNEHENHCMPT